MIGVVFFATHEDVKILGVALDCGVLSEREPAAHQKGKAGVRSMTPCTRR